MTAGAGLSSDHQCAETTARIEWFCSLITSRDHESLSVAPQLQRVIIQWHEAVSRVHDGDDSMSVTRFHRNGGQLPGQGCLSLAGATLQGSSGPAFCHATTHSPNNDCVSGVNACTVCAKREKQRLVFTI